MVTTLTASKARELIATMPPHPASGRVRVTHNPDPVIIAPLVNEAWIEAVIVPASDALKKELQTPENRLKPRDITDVSSEITCKVRNLPPGMNPYHAARIRSHCEYFNVLGHSPTSVEAYIFAYDKADGRSFAPKLHQDFDLNVYSASDGAPLEWFPRHIPLKLHNNLFIECRSWEEQAMLLKAAGISEDPNADLIQLEVGDTVIFGRGFTHKSSRAVAGTPEIQAQGLVGFSLNV